MLTCFSNTPYAKKSLQTINSESTAPLILDEFYFDDRDPCLTDY